MRRNGHNGACAVAREHVVRDVDRYLAARKWVDGIRASLNAAYALGVGNTLALRAALCLGDICLYCLAVLGCCKLLDPLVLGGDDHKRYAVDGIGACGKDLELAVAASNVEEYLSTYRAAYPVALNLLERVAPLERLKAVEHTLCIGCDAQQPLLHTLLLYGVATTHRETLLNLVVSKHSTECRTPVNHSVGAEGKAVILKHLLALCLAHSAPLGSREVEGGGLCGIETLSAVSLEVCYKGVDMLGLVCLVVVPVVEHL